VIIGLDASRFAAKAHLGRVQVLGAILQCGSISSFEDNSSRLSILGRNLQPLTTEGGTRCQPSPAISASGMVAGIPSASSMERAISAVAISVKLAIVCIVILALYGIGLTAIRQFCLNLLVPRGWSAQFRGGSQGFSTFSFAMSHFISF
jgi:hypothetical protein